MNQIEAATPQLQTRAPEDIVTTQSSPSAQIRTDAPNQVIAPNSETSTQVTPQPSQIESRAAANQEIRALAVSFDLGSDWSNDQIDRGVSEGEARAAALEVIRTRSTSQVTPTARVTVMGTNDAPEQIRERMAEALYTTRVNPGHEISDAAKQYTGLTSLDMARQCLEMRGHSSTGLTPADTITRALQTTSDYPAIFADTAGRVLRRGYEASPATLKNTAHQTTAKDFRAKTSIQLGEAPTLEKTNEHGEYKYGSFAEAKEAYSIDRFGRIIGLSGKAIINDDLSAFTDLAGKFGAAASDFEAQFLVDLLVANSGLGPTMDDGKVLFHADHANLAGAGGALSVTTLGAARLGMRRQKGLSDRPINVTPKFLLIPPELETDAEKLLASIQPATSGDVNPFGGKLELLVEARLTDTGRWYVIADPSQLEGLEYAYLQGNEGPQIESRAGFEVDGLEIKVRLDFGAAFLDYRGWYTNEGA